MLVRFHHDKTLMEICCSVHILKSGPKVPTTEVMGYMCIVETLRWGEGGAIETEEAVIILYV